MVSVASTFSIAVCYFKNKTNKRKQYYSLLQALQQYSTVNPLSFWCAQLNITPCAQRGKKRWWISERKELLKDWLLAPISARQRYPRRSHIHHRQWIHPSNPRNLGYLGGYRPLWTCEFHKLETHLRSHSHKTCCQTVAVPVSIGVRKEYVLLVSVTVK